MSRLLVSFSGGRTSGEMTKRLVDNPTYDEVKIVFANSTQEDERTLQFVKRCDEEWGLGVVWVEAVVHAQRGKGTTHRVVNFETATRDGSVFPEHRGNCVWCWKKSLRKHLTLARETPEVFTFPSRMERLYAKAGAGEGDRVFFRGGKSTLDLLELSKGDFERFVDPRMLDQAGGCSESCEVFGDDEPLHTLEEMLA